MQKEEDNEQLGDIMFGTLGIEYFDVLLKHNINKAFIDMAENNNNFKYLIKAKKECKARKVGFSFHDKANFLE